MIKAIISLHNGDRLDDSYKKLIEELMEISGYYSIIERKDNDNMWIEKEIWKEKKYTITSEFTKEEINFLQKHYDIQFLPPEINEKSIKEIAKELEDKTGKDNGMELKDNETLLLGVINMLSRRISEETGLGENDSSQVLLHILMSKEFSQFVLDEVKNKEKIMDLFKSIQRDNCFKITSDYQPKNK